MNTNYDAILQRLLRGNPLIYDSEREDIQAYINYILTKSLIDPYDTPTVIKVIKICNIIYNNAPNIMSPLNDDQYDRLLVLCKRQNIEYPVGAIPVQFRDTVSNDLDLGPATTEGPISVVDIIPNHDQMIYYKNIVKSQIPIKEDFIIDSTMTQEFKKQRTITHTYDLCGTLSKCKYILDVDAQNDGVYNDPSVSIFERDFLARHISMGLVDPNHIVLIVSLKYDGISVEATVKGDQIVDACTRGEMETGMAADLTPALQGLTFHRATNKVDPREVLGIKFEFILNKHNMELAKIASDKDYVNLRNAVIGLFGRLDARRFRDYFSPVPLESTIQFNPSVSYNTYPRILELEFLNQFYTKGIDMRYQVLSGTYVEVLYQLKKFAEEADLLREYMDFQCDGLVVEYADPNLRNTLGKTKSIPNYATAIKFPPMRRVSMFTHYTYSVGQSGVITPKAHFLPVEFMGQIHDKTTVHSLRRFKELNLRNGDKVVLTLNNDVIVYLTKAPDSLQVPNNTAPYEQFPTHCPSCGTPLLLSDTGDSAYCPNFMCPERCISRLANMFAKLNIKGFATESIRALNVYKLKDLISVPKEVMQSILGEIKGNNLRYIIDNDLLNTVYPDYQIIGSLGFTGLALSTWKLIFQYISIKDLVNMTDEELYRLKDIKGIGSKKVQIIINERNFFRDELLIILNQMKYIVSGQTTLRGVVRFTGVRDDQITMAFNEKGFDADPNGSLTSSTTILIVPFMGYESSKVFKAFELLNRRLSLISEAQGLSISGYQDLNIARQFGLLPQIMTVEEAKQYIESL